uniref:TonB-dependent transporter Oar-like beta-barrel domain-containing protein n=1 Tax=Solibacter usitatus (strain Ellin6076) TaxID=234267 RepID=Q01TK2_SOLUE
MHRVSLRTSFLTFATLGVSVFQAFGQQATIVGTATDPSGGAVPNVSITITNSQTNQVTRVATNTEGQYLAPGLQIGHYGVRAEIAGFKKAERTDVVLAVGDRTRVDFRLEIGTAQESISVEATPVAVQSESGEISDVITGAQVSQLSTNGRSIYSLAILTAGASSNMADFQSATPVGGDSTVSFNGLRSSHNIYLIDGGENLDRGGAGGISVMPSVDAIAEFRQLTSNYSAEYGLSSAGTMTMVFKSGTKQFHASGWEFVRNEDLDANTYFRNAAGVANPLNRLNTYGFNVEGPVFIPKLYNVKKEKTFFFYNMEWRKAVTGGALNTTVPLTSQYGGNMGSTAIHVPNANQLSAAQIARFNAAGLAPGQAFPNNVIPTSLLDPNAQLLLKTGIFPGPTSGNKFVGGNNAPTNVREELFRIDHHFTDKFWLFGHWVDESIMSAYGTSMWSGDNVPTASNTFGNPSYSGVIHATYTISPTLLNETSFNYNGNRIAILPQGVIARPPGLNIPRLFSGPNDLDRIPGINLSGATGTNYTLNWMPWNNKADDYQIRDDFSWTKGAHQLKFGGSWALYKKIQDLFANTEGGFTFNGQYTGNDFADFLLGYSSQYQEAGVKDSGKWNNQSWALYAQDNWKVSRKLTLNLGLRWDGIPHTYEANNRQSNFYPSLYDLSKRAVLTADGSTISPSSPGLGGSPNDVLKGYQFYLNGIGIAGQNGTPAGLVKNYWGAIAPRVGFAYDPVGNGKTVIRGGFGVMYERIQGNDVYNAGPNVPFSAQVTFNNVSLSNPNVSLLSGQTLVAPITIADITGLAYSDYKSPASYQFSFGVQQELGKGSVVSVSYVGNTNRHQNDYRETNLPAPSQLAGLINGTAVYNSVVPYAGFHSIRLSENAINSHYNSLQINYHGRINNSLSLQGAYTLSKSFDPVAQGGNAQDLQNVSNPYDRSYDNGPSPLDRRHIGLINFIYQIPAFNGKNTSRLMKSTLGGWELSGIGTIETGFPLNINLGGSQGSNGLANATNRPNVNGTVDTPHTINAWFGASAFSLPALGAWGNFPRGSVYGPGRHNWNLSLFKSFVFSEARNSRLEFRAETFNTFNHTQFQNVSSTFTASDFGHVTSTYNPRNIQLGVKLMF